ncbi:hypothetical protein NW755_005583 [Fusarium falciforme]|uniref:Chromo domain-containing protein n=1 Tax=Fusarium falciforme TaxID=195108 RepID=A0A9W8RB12_9HYPO|nr:hypothetical protein NW755_005583 [Fusarium falciforme]
MGQINEVPKARIISNHTDNSKELISRAPPQNNQGKECHDRPLPLDQEGTEFEVERLVAKGRIGRRVWYKVKWKGYPESDNSWVKKKDIGTGATANYEAKSPYGRDEFKFERLVSKQEVEGVTLYEAKWQGQPESENIWVDKWDLGSKAIAAFETSLST